MPAIHVTPLSRLHETVEASGASHVVTLINVSTPVERPASIPQERHLFIGVSDIVQDMDGHVLPGQDHVERLLGFVRQWDREKPMVIHCWAGISRSTAAAFISLCALRPDRDEAELARELRLRAPSATPNARLVSVADALLRREGRMTEAVAAIGRGADAFEGTPFHLKVE
ncbi:tyrosine phosphatase family protein [uncultured Alsobacter sp.]|uniref:tyrosine phosphatase family protein n=1 Tax=uncultured Alsobacter sp. TaxID=1748258 RepID=UPI0025DFBAA8|nr:tyrosine phosphatase family protein [uncultured Alsobacter sp.]